MAPDTSLARRIADLKREIEAHNHAYYVLGEPTIADGEWDRLFHELVALGHLEPLGKGALALARPKIVLQD